ncbi:MAG: hypothetical protein V7K48_07405 [Nostoc sp.]|uniref:hypothetical protein n=1 Tax=Nostoc sp. TaxID=1180 RepID=UPI002FFBD584
MSNQFKAEVFQNQYLHQGAREVDAIMTITVEKGDSAIATANNSRLFGIICDTSGSMGGDKIHAVKDAMTKIVNLLPEDAHFFIVIGAGRATVVFPVSPATTEKSSQRSPWLY